MYIYNACKQKDYRPGTRMKPSPRSGTELGTLAPLQPGLIPPPPMLPPSPRVAGLSSVSDALSRLNLILCCAPARFVSQVLDELLCVWPHSTHQQELPCARPRAPEFGPPGSLPTPCQTDKSINRPSPADSQETAARQPQIPRLLLHSQRSRLLPLVDHELRAVQ